MSGAAQRGLRSSDFERLLAVRPCVRSPHFVLHHVPAAPPDLSTPPDACMVLDVDDSRPGGQAPHARFGLVVPQRHARRAVTRSLIKRQGRAAWCRHASALAQGDWLLRLRAGFAADQYPSAASTALRLAVRGELDALFAGAARAGRAA